MEYIRLSEGVKNYRLIPTTDDIWDYIQTTEKDYYQSIYKYTEDHYRIWKDKKSVRGITDVKTDKLVFDFDSEDHIEKAQHDTKVLVNRLRKLGVDDSAIRLSFSGNKGFCVEVHTTSDITPKEFKVAVMNLAGDLETFDKVVYDPNRILRVIGTKNLKSGLYKIPLKLNDLDSSCEQIKKSASALTEEQVEITRRWKKSNLPKTVFEEPKKEKESGIFITEVADLSNKPKWMIDAKYALQEGYFLPGERNSAFMILAATYRSQGFNEELAFRLLQGVADIQAKRNNQDRFTDQEIKNNILSVVYSDGWQGGTYSYEATPLLQEVTKRLGLKPPKEDFSGPKHINNITDKFKNHVKNIDKNTIKTGIKTLDDNLFISTGTNLAILGSPGSGKSSLALEILRNTSKAGIKSVFASLDMVSIRIYEKILYKLTGEKRDNIYSLFQNDQESKVVDLINENYKNVYFFDKTMPTVDDLRNYILACQEHSGEKIKLVLVDYFERLYTDINEDTAASKKLAGQLQDLVNDLDICLITLVQPNKLSGDLSHPIYSYTNIKGSSFLAQSFRMILGVYREGFDPRIPEQDRFLTVNVLKNDLGEVASYDFSWNGKRGEITELSDDERFALAGIRKHKDLRKSGDL
jgi:ABC-type dipeptide/oligopeptide/nickel transport system ATPase subunit